MASVTVRGMVEGGLWRLVRAAWRWELVVSRALFRRASNEEDEDEDEGEDEEEDEEDIVRSGWKGFVLVLGECFFFVGVDATRAWLKDG
jgi:hypothetical protein